MIFSLDEKSFLEKIRDLDQPARITENYKTGRYELQLYSNPDDTFASPEIYPMSVQDAERTINLIELEISGSYRFMTRYTYCEPHPWEEQK